MQRSLSRAMIMKPARQQQQSDARAIERPQVPCRAQQVDGGNQGQRHTVRSHTSAPQAASEQDQRGADEEKAKKLQASKAKQRPCRPQYDLVKPFEVGNLLSGDCVGERLRWPELAGPYD